MYVLFFILNEVCVCTYVYFFYTIGYVMQEKVVIFLTLHIFIYFTVRLVLNSHEVIQKCFYFLCLLNNVCVQINAFLWLKTWGERKNIQVTFTFTSWFEAVLYPLVEPVFIFLSLA